MNQTKIHSKGNIPFSWEKKPGVSKMSTPGPTDQEEQHSRKPDFGEKLPPPPCPVEQPARMSSHDIHIPLPPCAFQRTYRSSSRKGIKKLDQDDPFMVAYKACTKTKMSKHDTVSRRFKQSIFSFSCKHSCGVRDDNLVRVSQIPFQKDADN